MTDLYQVRRRWDSCKITVPFAKSRGHLHLILHKEVFTEKHVYLPHRQTLTKSRSFCLQMLSPTFPPLYPHPASSHPPPSPHASRAAATSQMLSHVGHTSSPPSDQSDLSKLQVGPSLNSASSLAVRANGMAQPVRTHTDPAEDPSSVPSNHGGQLTTAYNSSSRAHEHTHN